MKSVLALALLIVGAIPQDEKPQSTVMTIEELLAAAGPKLDLKFVYSEEVPVKTKKVTVPALNEKTSKEEVLATLETALMAVDLAMIPGDSKVTPALITNGLTASKRALPVLGAIDPVPAGNGMYTKVFKLKHVSPREVHAMLINMVAYPQAILPCESAGTATVSDYASNLRRLAKVIEELDRGE